MAALFGDERVNVTKTKVMRCGTNSGEVARVGKWPCGVCGKGVARNSIRCKECELWVYKRCSKIHGSLASKEGNFICSCCNGVNTRPVKEGIQLQGDVNFECVGSSVILETF